MTNSPKSGLFIPNSLIWMQSICFSVLYAIWALPETILIRHICLIVGALIGLYQIIVFRHLLLSKRAIPAWLVLTLFLWASLHLFFFSNDYAAQYEEFTSIWKRAGIGAIFGLGFGLGLAHNRMGEDGQKGQKGQKGLWAIIYLGLLAPTIIYILKFILTLKGKEWGIAVSDYWLLYYGSAPFYIPKTTYVCFCLPTLGVALGQLASNISRHHTFKWVNLIYLATIPAVFFVFYGENIKNGVVYGAALVLLFALILLKRNIRGYLFLKLSLLFLIATIGCLFVAKNIQTNDSWRTFIADAKIARDTQTYPQWKYSGTQGYPNNEFGTMVSVTNYERMAWAKEGLKLVLQNPLGYGLVERSFGHLAKIKFPDSLLHQSHSGWIDLTLGIGIPGMALIMGSLLTLLYQLAKFAEYPLTQSSLAALLWWVLVSTLIIWCTTEISQKVYFDDLIFWLALGSGFLIANPKTPSASDLQVSSY